MISPIMMFVFMVVFAVIIIAVVYFMFKKFTKSQKTTTAEVKKVEPPAFVEVEPKLANTLLFQPVEKRGILYVKMREDKIPPGCQQHLADWVGKWLFFVENHDGVFKQYEPPSTVDQLPSELYEAILMPANRKLWSLSRNPLEKIAMWAPVVVAGAGMFLLFAMAN